MELLKWQKDLLDDRLAEYCENPDNAFDFCELIDEIENKLLSNK